METQVRKGHQMNIADRKANLESIISEVVGEPVELTVRGLGSFTFSTETVVADLGDKVAEYFGRLATVSVDHDDECGSFVFVEVVA